MFIVMPAIDLKERKCVQLVQGDPRRKIVELEDPLSVAKHWIKLGAKRLHVVDLDGAIEGRRINQDIVEEIAKLSEIEYGGGLRSYEEAKEFLERGIHKIILGTLALKNPEIVKKLSKEFGSDRIIVALDCREGYVVIKGWKEKTSIKAEKAVKVFENVVDEVLFTNVDVEGKMSGIDIKIIENFIKSTSVAVIVSGGISSVEDIKAIKDLGARGVVVGSALYKGKIDFREAVKLQEGV